VTAAQVVLAMSVPARPERLAELRARVGAALRAIGCGADTADAVIMAVNEACANIIRHGYRGDPAGAIELEIINNDREVIVRLRDYAPPVDPERLRPRNLDEPRPGGLGTHFISTLMDSCRFLPPPQGTGNLLELRKKKGDADAV
jgi:sigma-B regulation protein RsbU (phosphoserine phosphatase)